MAENAEKKGKALCDAAEKKLKSWSMPIFGSASQKQEDAVELLDKAAAQYKIAGKWDDVAKIYIKCAKISESLKINSDVYSFYQKAGKAYKNVSANDAVKMYKLCVVHCQDNNRFSQAAKLYKTIAEIEQKEKHTKEAAQAWSEAATCYTAEDSKASANQCLVKVAALSAEMEDYTKAIEIYEQVANTAMNSDLGRWSVSDYFYKASLCHFVLAAREGSLVPLEDAFARYIDLFPQFEGSRDAKLIQKLIPAFNDGDEGLFTEHVKRHDAIYKMDNWTCKMLLDVKEVLQGGGGAGGPVFDIGAADGGDGDNPAKDPNEIDWT